MTSLIGFEYLLRLNGFDDGFDEALNSLNFCSGNKVYINDEIKKSSVGEHYISQMGMFVDAVERLIPVLDSFLSKFCPGAERHTLLANCIQKFYPLGLELHVENPDLYINEFFETGRNLNKFSYLMESFREVQRFYKSALTEDFFSDEALAFHKKKDDILERIGVSLCTGYTPQTPASIVTRVSNDSDHFNEALLSYILYPWVTQPFSQLKMLMSTLPEDLQGNIRSAYFDDMPSGIVPGVATGLVGNTLTFEIMADYRTYLECLLCRRELPTDAALIIQRQAWTPWFGFDFPSALEGIDGQTMGLLNDLMKKSSKLFIDILHTGLQWDSQYALLSGYRGRFIVSGTLNGMKALVYDLSKGDKPLLCKQVAKCIGEELGVLFPYLSI